MITQRTPSDCGIVSVCRLTGAAYQEARAALDSFAPKAAQGKRGMRLHEVVRLAGELGLPLVRMNPMRDEVGSAVVVVVRGQRYKVPRAIGSFRFAGNWHFAPIIANEVHDTDGEVKPLSFYTDIGRLSSILVPEEDLL